MRGVMVGFLAGFGLLVIAASSEAAPAVPQNSAADPAIIQVRGGCGPGWHPRARRDRWGHWRRECVPNRW